MLRHVVLYKSTDVSEVFTASIIRQEVVSFYQTAWRNIPEDSILHICLSLQGVVVFHETFDKRLQAP
jgi:hypothetical protein